MTKYKKKRLDQILRLEKESKNKTKVKEEIREMREIKKDITQIRTKE
jgi:hypothetical protein